MTRNTLFRLGDWGIYALFIVIVLGLPLMMDDVFWLNRIAKYLVYGMLGIAIALSWGYAGILTLGQGLFFGLGAYMVAMSLKLQSYTSMQQGSDRPVPTPTSSTRPLRLLMIRTACLRPASATAPARVSPPW